MYKADIIIRCYNNFELTKRCIESIYKNTNQKDFRLIVVDNGSTDGTKEYLNKLYLDKKNVIVIRSYINEGAIKATNKGLKQIDSNFVLILDNDTEILEGDLEWLDRLLSYFKDKKVGAVAATSDKVSGMQCIFNFPKWPDELKYFISFAVMLRRDVIGTVGYWDERYGLGNFEDIDYSIRMKQAGYKIVLAKDVFIKHIAHATFSKVADVNQLIAENKMKGIEKWGEKIIIETLG